MDIVVNMSTMCAVLLCVLPVQADSWEDRPGPCFKSLVGTPGYMAPEIMSSFFTGAAELARRSKDAAFARRSKDTALASASATAAGSKTTQKQQQQQQPASATAGSKTTQKHQQKQQPPAEAAAVAAAASGDLKPSSSAAVAGGDSKQRLQKAVRGMKRSASGKLAELAAAAAKGAAAVPGGSGISRSLAAVAAAVGLPDAEAEAELAVVGDYDGEKADVYSLGVLLVVIVLRRMPWNYDTYADRWVCWAWEGLHAEPAAQHQPQFGSSGCCWSCSWSCRVPSGVLYSLLICRC